MTIALGLEWIIQKLHCHSERSEESAFENLSMKEYFVYIVASKSRTLYVGVTNNLMRRLYEHKHKLLGGFTAKYSISRLIYYEITDSIEAAITREKQIKAWSRFKKVALIEGMNPTWEDLSEKWI